MTSMAVEPRALHPPTPRRVRRWEVGILVAWFGAISVVRSGVLQETDPYWQVRTGIENLRGAPLSRPDTWSWAPVEGAFTQTSPLWNDVLGLGYSTAGFAGFFTVSLVSLLAYFATATALALRLGARPLSVLAGVLIAVVPALAMLSPRASLVAQTLFMAGLLAADTWRRRTGRPTAVLDALVVGVAAFAVAALGSWVHLSWLVLAPATAVAWTVLWWSSPTVTGTRRSVLSVSALLGVGAGVVAGPHGLSAWALSQQVQEACEGVVLEWAGMFTPSLALRWAPAGLLAIAGFSLAGWWAFRAWKRRLDDPRVGLVAALVVVGGPAALAAVEAIRFIGIALLLLAPLAAMAVGAVTRRVGARVAADPSTGVFSRGIVRRWARPDPWRVVLTAVAALLLPVGLVAAATLGRPASVASVAGALPEGCRLFSDPGSAGAVLLLRPDVTVWIDGRADYWGHDRNAEAVRDLSGDATDVSGIDGATCVVLQTSPGLDTGRLARSLDADGTWTRLDRDAPVGLWLRAPSS